MTRADQAEQLLAEMSERIRESFQSAHKVSKREALARWAAAMATLARLLLLFEKELKVM